MTFYNCLGQVFINYCFLQHGTCSDQVIVSQCSLVQIKACSLLAESFVFLKVSPGNDIRNKGEGKGHHRTGHEGTEGE
jgi:hypothetical protein